MGLRHPAFIATAALYLLLRIGAAYGLPLPLLHGHLTDLLCMPVVLTLAQSTVRLLFPHFRVNAPLAWATCAAFALWFEWWLPAIDPRHTADWVDVGCYAAGTGVFILLNQSQSKETSAQLR
jgi:hypothetical protein